MRCLANGADFVLAHPAADSRVQLSSKMLLDKIVDGMWRNGEPGVQFIDTVNRLTSKHTEKYERYNTGIETSNPCLHGATRLATSSGLRTIQSLPGERGISSYDDSRTLKTLTKIWNTGIKHCVKLTLQSGEELICTPEHTLKQQDDNWYEAGSCLGKTLKSVDLYNISWNGEIPEEYSNRDLCLLGYIFGDGSCHKASKRVKYTYIGEKDGDILDYVKRSADASWFDLAHKSGPNVPLIKGYCDKMFNSQIPTRQLPEFIFSLNKSDIGVFLRGLFSANGYVVNDGIYNRRICLKSACREMISQVQLLLRHLGIRSKLLSEADTTIEFPNGEYDTKRSYTLKIFEHKYIQRFKDQIGFIHRYKVEAMDTVLSETRGGKVDYNYDLVTGIDDYGETEVYDFSQPETQCALANGLVVHNCSEAFLAPHESCCLGSINLYKFVTPWWTGQSQFAWERLADVIEAAVDFLNRVIDKSEAPLEAINTRTREARKIGIGIMGLADAMSALGLPYASTQGRNFAKQMMGDITKVAEKYSESKGYKNAMLTLVAPTGTIGLVAGVSQGIEPHFRLKYTRKSIKLGDIEMFCQSLSDFLAAQPNEVRTKCIANLERNNGKFQGGTIALADGALAMLESFWPTADQLTPMEHLNMLEVIQSEVHNGVSKTINLPNSATREDIRDLIMTAWKKGIKGFTVYRDGSREVQVLNEIKKEEKCDTKILSTPSASSSEQPPDTSPTLSSTGATDLLKRSRVPVTSGYTTKVKTGCGNLYVVTNMDQKGPCEVFTNLGRSGGCPSQSEATARLISLCLRSGIPVDEVTEQLIGIRCMSTVARKDKQRLPDGQLVKSCPDAIGKCLKMFADRANGYSPAPAKETPMVQAPRSEVHPADAEPCSECGAATMPSGGCRVCTRCSYSKCG